MTSGTDRPGGAGPAAGGNPHPGGTDRSLRRRVTLAVGAAVMLVASTIGSGALGGTPIDEAAGGALASDATPLAPGGPAFGIWSVIYLGLVALAAWQALPGQRSNARLARLDILILGSFLLNGAWILSVQAGWLGGSVVLIVALLAVLAATFRSLVRHPPLGRVETVLLDGTMGLYLGWVTVATVANVTAWLTAMRVGAGGGPAEPLGVTGTLTAIAVVAVAGAIGAALAAYGRGRWSVAAAMVWGLVWIAVARFTGDLVTIPVGVTALLAAGAIVVATVLARRRRVAA